MAVWLGGQAFEQLVALLPALTGLGAGVRLVDDDEVGVVAAPEVVSTVRVMRAKLCPLMAGWTIGMLPCCSSSRSNDPARSGSATKPRCTPGRR